MGKAFEGEQSTISLYNNTTTTISAYHFVRLEATAANTFYMRLPTTALTHVTVGITQEDVPAASWGRVAISGISRVKVGSTALAWLKTTTNCVAANANGHAVQVLASTSFTQAQMVANAAASDVTTVFLSPICARRKL